MADTLVAVQFASAFAVEVSTCCSHQVFARVLGSEKIRGHSQCLLTEMSIVMMEADAAVMVGSDGIVPFNDLSIIMLAVG